MQALENAPVESGATVGLTMSQIAAREGKVAEDPVANFHSIQTVDVAPMERGATVKYTMNELAKHKADHVADVPLVRKDVAVFRHADESTDIGNAALATANIGRAADPNAFRLSDARERPAKFVEPKPVGTAAEIAPGFEWSLVLSILVSARRALKPKESATEARAALASLSPHEAYLSVNALSVCPAAGGAALPSPDLESDEQFEARKRAQRRCASYILPKGQGETDAQFEARLQARRPRSQAAPKRSPALVLPYQPTETSSDFDERMESQARHELCVLPKGKDESKGEYAERLAALQATAGRWGGSTAPPLVLPRSKCESVEQYRARLVLALQSNQCPVLLPQAFKETEAMAARRFELQRKLGRDICIYPFSAVAETEESFEERMAALAGSIEESLAALEPAPPAMARASLAEQSVRLNSVKGGPGRVASPSIASRLGSYFGVGRPVRSAKLSGGSIWRPREPSLLDEGDDGMCCCCCFPGGAGRR